MAGDFDAIVARMLGAVAHRSRALVAIDGVGASRKSIFTARLARSVGTPTDLSRTTGHAIRSCSPNLSRRLPTCWCWSRAPSSIATRSPRCAVRREQQTDGRA